MNTLCIFLGVIIAVLLLRIWWLHHVINTWKGHCYGWQWHYNYMKQSYDDMCEKYVELNKQERKE